MWVQLLGGQGTRTCFILVLRECIGNVPTVSLVLPTYDDTSSLCSPPRRVVCPPSSMVPPWVTASRFFASNREAELKPTFFSLLLLFCVFLYSSSPDPPGDIVPLSAACWGYSLVIMIIIIHS